MVIVPNTLPARYAPDTEDEELVGMHFSNVCKLRSRAYFARHFLWLPDHKRENAG